MYLSRVRVATEGLDRNILYRLMQGDAYGNHQLLWQLFPGEAERPFLFRQEIEREGSDGRQPRGLPMFYVLSHSEPVEVPGLLACETKPLTPRLRPGMRLAFRLRANPVVARRQDGSGRSPRHDVLMDAKRSARAEGMTAPAEIRRRMDEAAQAWLADERRSARHGYRLLAAPEVTGYRQHAHRRRDGREVRFSSIDFQGALEVADPARFEQTLGHGIGRSRAFGCGLCLVRRVA